MNIATYYDKQAMDYIKRLTSGSPGRRKRQEKEYVLKLLYPKKGEKILDAGCGTGYYSGFIKKAGCEVIGIDISEKMIEEAKKLGIKTRICNLENFDLNEKFDKIVSCGALEFCKKHLSVLRNLKKHLKKGGSIVILIPALSTIGILYKIYHLKNGINITLFSKKRIKKLLGKAGLKPIKIVRPVKLSYIIKAAHL